MIRGIPPSGRYAASDSATSSTSLMPGFAPSASATIALSVSSAAFRSQPTSSSDLISRRRAYGSVTSTSSRPGSFSRSRAWCAYGMPMEKVAFTPTRPTRPAVTPIASRRAATRSAGEYPPHSMIGTSLTSRALGTWFVRPVYNAVSWPSSSGTTR